MRFKIRRPGSVVGIATAYGLDGPEIESIYYVLPNRQIVWKVYRLLNESASSERV
jgi:hypothetical protein